MSNAKSLPLLKAKGCSYFHTLPRRTKFIIPGLVLLFTFFGCSSTKIKIPNKVDECVLQYLQLGVSSKDTIEICRFIYREEGGSWINTPVTLSMEKTQQ